MIRKLLLVEADSSSQEQCARVLRDYSCEVIVANSLAQALTALKTRAFDAMLADFRLASAAGCDLTDAARRAQPGIHTILMVEAMGDPVPHQPLRLRGFPLLTKPLRIEEVARALKSAAETPPPPPVEPEPATRPPAPQGLPGLVGASEKMQRIHRLITKVARQRHPVLIMGESGTGKELVARALHRLSPWQKEPFVPVDCGALPPTLIESELFGHVKGAFTGAAQSRQGLLAAAGAGTVFLDEIGELPIELQSRLLRALQEHEVRPLGSNERTKFEARIVAATNQNLEAGIQSGTFRKDLFFRLNVVTIKMPPLRDRPEDIPELVRHFLAHYGDAAAAMQVSDEALGRMMNYPWPGNVRELENCIQRAVSLGSGTFIQMQDLPSAMLYQLAAKSASPRRDSGSLQELEQQAIRKALAATGGDRVRAAKLLGIGKTTIYRKLKEYGIDVTTSET